MYRDITPGAPVSAAYIESGSTFAETQLAKAGYRLADTLIEIWQEPHETATEVGGLSKFLS